MAMFELRLPSANDVGLFIDPTSGEDCGNLPQGFNHMAVINHGVWLANAKRAKACAAMEPNRQQSGKEEEMACLPPRL